MIRKKFIALHEVKNRPVVMIDGSTMKDALILSHWKELNTLPFADNTSAGIVLNALQASDEQLQKAQYITATHFDIDGFLGVWAAFYPEIALKYDKIVRHAAIIGDFREYEYESDDATQGLKIACLINSLEKKNFYAPFESKQEARSCVAKFEYFIPRFAEMIEHLESYQDEWKPEFDVVINDCKVLYNTPSSITKFPEIGLTVIRTTKPLHYYSLFGATRDTDIVLTIYDNQRYELEYKYTTWIDLASRPTLPRVAWDNLAEKLNTLETSGMIWKADKITEGGALLRLYHPITKAQKFANPYQRKILSSSIPENTITDIVISFFQQAYQNITPKKNWTWQSIRAFNQELNLDFDDLAARS